MEPVHRRIPPGHELNLGPLRVYIYRGSYVGFNGRKIVFRRRWYPIIALRRWTGRTRRSEY